MHVHFFPVRLGDVCDLVSRMKLLLPGLFVRDERSVLVGADVRLDGLKRMLIGVVANIVGKLVCRV